MFELEGKKILLTGATGALGQSISRVLASHGAKIALSGTKEEPLNTLAQEVNGIAIPCRLDQSTDVETLVEKAEQALGGVDILVNNAGLTRDQLLLKMKDEDWDQVLAVNLTACFKLCRQAIKGMMKQRFGRIINISSVVGFTGNPGQSNYCASKAGLVGFSKALAQEVASRGITVNCIAPGFMASAMTESMSEIAQERILKNIPMNRMGSPEDVAFCAAFLASSKAGYITGQTLHVNGGLAMF